MMSIALGNRLKKIREHEQIETSALASVSRVSERTVMRFEKVHGMRRLRESGRDHGAVGRKVSFTAGLATHLGRT